MSPIQEQYKLMSDAIKTNPQIERQLLFKLQRLNHIVQMNFVQRHEEGYCARFIIPDKDFLSIFSDIPELKDENIKSAFKAGWKLPSNANAHMHSNIYYQKLCLIIYHSAKTNNTELGEFALRLILFRLWNGRITKLIKWCNPDIMAAAIANCKSQKFKFKQYSTPLDLIQQYYTPTIYTKYKSYILRDINETKRLFEQSYHRIKQLFGSGSKPDIETGGTRYTSGLQPFYYAAYEQRERIGTRKTDSDTEFDDRMSSSDTNVLINSIVTHMTVTNNTYDTSIVDFIASNIKGIKRNKIEILLEKMHQLKYSDILQDIIELYFRRFSGSAQKDFCSPDYYNKIKSNIISSKNNQDIANLKKLVDILLDQIFKNDLDKAYDDYMEKTLNQRAQYKTIIYYGIAYNIKQVICNK
jgi:hypothetical protein